MLLRLCGRIRKQEGFTLIELIVVVAILGILAAIVTPRVLNALNDAKAKSALAYGKQVQLAMERYYVDNGEYPTDVESGLEEYLNVEAGSLKVEGYARSDDTDTYELIINVGQDGEDRYVYVTPPTVEETEETDVDAVD